MDFCFGILIKPKTKTMKRCKFILVFLSCTCLGNIAFGQLRDNAPSNETVNENSVSQKKKLNFFVISKRKKGKFDPATRFNVFRAKWRSFFHRKHMITIIATDITNMNKKVNYWLNKDHADIGTIWFDSHGSYKKGYSIFHIGNDEISYKTLKVKETRSALENLATHTTGDTRIIIGSCYGGATYERASIDYRDTTRMKGDSLMIALGKIIRNGIVYGSESWVMTKPGLFRKQPAVGGAPGQHLFLDVCYEPAWKNVGVWNQYDIYKDSFEKINPVALDKKGNLVIRSLPFIIEKHKEKKIEKKLSMLQPDLYK
jgi:hypothetical protein